MGLFTKKKEGVQKIQPPQLTELPRLPSLPKMPGVEPSINSGFPKMKTSNSEPLNNLPSFPNNSLGSKFSQNTIKQAVTGNEEENDYNHYEDDEESTPTMPIRKPRSREYDEPPIMQGRKEPVFIRLDKFEETIKIFETAKTQITQIESMLTNIKKRKEEEEKALANWEQNIQKIKMQIEKIDKEVFSKIE
ncbi:hypothetical protein HOG16_03920 [Candidatus Woesearchaeota archaeon]|jgi:hypothetical protein|nr:hypothetical protein [Candidatus Woesearchaeota archaeon]